jgi:ABC-2 type transport system permease protein
MATSSAERPEATLWEELAICRHLLGAKIRGQLQYRVSFIFQILGNVTIHGVELVALLALFNTFDQLGSWRAGEVAFLYAVTYVSFAIGHMAATGFHQFGRMIVRGEFDRVLTRPMNPFLQILASDLNLRHFGGMLQGLFAFALALSLVEIEWSLGKALYLPVFIVSAGGLYLMLFTLEATLCFWTTESNEAVNAITYGGRTLAVYPLTIYDVWLRRFFLFIVPIGFVIFLPANYLLDKPLPFGFPAWTQFIAPPVTVAFGFFAAWLWRLGISKYRSTGS